MARVVIADDDEGLRIALRAMMEGTGVEVIETSSADELIATCRANPPAAVFCDMFMPEKDGIEAIRVLCREFPGIRIAAMSGGGFQGTMDLLPVARHLGAADVLYKPFDRATVLAVLRRLLGESGPK